MKLKLKPGTTIYHISMWNTINVTEGVVTEILEDCIIIKWAFYTHASKHPRMDTRFWDQVVFCCSKGTA